ncbi:putative membrane-anchored protein [Marmoricola sp. OAE513]|uniref:putative cytokinetic ring protein SteA n=1 Tax=Marmoricola sp. OAE513 TaxID=2817894 RepID=UPI001AE856A0
MRFSLRRPAPAAPPGVTLRVHAHRDTATLLARDLTGCLVVIDHRDLDAETARTLLDRRPYAVLNAAEFISGRFANLGPKLLAENGVVLLEGAREGILALSDGSTLRLHDGTLYDGPVVALDVQAVEIGQITRRMTAASSGLAAQLETFAHTTSELLRHEEGFLLHGEGIPQVQTPVEGRPVVVVGPTARPEDLKKLRGFLREQKPALIAVDGGADVAVERGLRPDVVVLSAAGQVRPRTLTRCREVLLVGAGAAARRRAEDAGKVVHETSTDLAGTDVGLLLAHRAGARLVIPVGYPSTLEDFIDRNRSAQASNVLTRLKVGAVLVEASAVPLLYTGRVRRWQVALTLVVALGVLAVAVAATPVGQDWWHDLRPHLPGSLGR